MRGGGSIFDEFVKGYSQPLYGAQRVIFKAFHVKTLRGGRTGEKGRFNKNVGWGGRVVRWLNLG